MDVDAAQLTAEINLASTDETKKKPRPKVRCYFCNIEGHIKANCRKFLAAQERGEVPQKAKARATTVENDEEETKETPPAYDPDSLMVHIRKMKIEDRDSFLDRLLVQDNEGF